MSDKPTEKETKRDKAAARRREKILEAAMMCFIENGYHQTGVRDIARRAGVSLGNLYNHFSGKHDVLVEIAALERDELDPFLDLLAEPAPAPKTLDNFVTAYANYLAKPENVILTIEVSSEAVRKPDIGELFVANRKELTAALALVITRGADDGDFRANLDADEAAQLVIDLIDASAYRTVLGEAAMRHVLGGLKDFITASLRP
ncbi:TetR/AcrR family transcriptional regulator [Oricola sp.]|uniref:TetR/AcrR family transcriptional regulator n=1 Tax=Oricola sp. TaxID=1979950 RepID=UPI003BA85916